MADKKITQLTALTGANTAADDPLVIVDLSANETKKIDTSELFKAVPAGSAAAPSIAAQGDQNTGIYFPAADTLGFVEGGVEAMRLDASGNLLLGGTSAQVNGKFQVTGNIGLAGNSQIRQASNGDSNTLQVFATQLVVGSLNSTSYNYSGGGLVASVAAGDLNVLIDAGRATSTDGRFKIQNTTSANTSLSLVKGSAYTMYADTGSGSVGIGTDTPATFGKLAVAGNTVPTVTNSFSLGTSTYRWSNVHATTFTENGFNVVSQTDLGSNPNEVPLNQYLGQLAYQDQLGLFNNLNTAPTLLSATTIQPVSPIQFVSGTTAIVNITVPPEFAVGGGQLTLIPTGLWTTTTAGNIALATTAVVNRAVTMFYDAATTKWYPSY
jgi:hypothetical protein